MKSQIWKFPLSSKQEVHTFKAEIEMPKYTTILTAQMQGSIITMWGTVPIQQDDPNQRAASFDIRKFVIYGTGWKFEDSPDLKYIATVQDSANLVWHIFEDKRL